MKAAIVRSYERGPEFGDFEEPLAKTEEVVVTVKAAALSRLVQSQASGQHYSSDGRFSFVPGGDGVGVLPDGQRVYFAFPTSPFGSMAERTVVPASLCVSLPDELDDVTAAAAANPGMSSCAALMERAKLGADGEWARECFQRAIGNSVGEGMRAMIPKGFEVSAQPVPLAQVARIWASKTTDRIVFTSK